jgi:hypothetical protein
MSIDEFDSIEIRCPRLGGEAIFKYCRTCEDPFCYRIIVCWAQRLDIGTYLAENFSAEQIQVGLEKKGGDKISQLIKLTEKSKLKN